MKLSGDQTFKLKRKLRRLANEFPNTNDVVDLDRLNDLATIPQVRPLIQTVFLRTIEQSAEHYLKMFGDVCLEFAFSNLADSFVGYCLNNRVIADIEQQGELVDTIIKAITRFELFSYLDIERQSSRIRFVAQSSEFTLDIKRVSRSERSKILRLLRDFYVNKLLDKTLAEWPDSQARYIEKHNNITSLIRTLLSRGQLEETRWTRLYALESLEYGPNTSSELFKNHPPDPVVFDELLWKHFNILLIPAFGNIDLAPRKVTISNEGRGCIKNPSLEVHVNGTLVTRVSANGVVLAHRSYTFRLSQEDVNKLRLLDPNGQLAFHLAFHKFDDTPFRFVHSMNVGEVLDYLNPDGQDLQAIAQSIRVSPERIKALAQAQITNDQELFETIQKFMNEIRRLVEQDDGHRLLTDSRDNGKRTPRNESDIQIALKHWLKPMCKALNIDINREPRTGRGDLDFKFSIGHDLKCLVEVKLVHSAKLQHGIKVQLPTYLKAEPALFGIYVPIIFEETTYESELEQLRNNAHKLAQTHRVEIEVIDIKAWKPKSASTVQKLEDADRYSL